MTKVYLAWCICNRDGNQSCATSSLHRKFMFYNICTGIYCIQVGYCNPTRYYTNINIHIGCSCSKFMYWNMLYLGRMLQSYKILHLFQHMSVPRILQRMFLCIMMYLYWFQCTIQHTIVLYWVTCKYNNLWGCGDEKHNDSQTWRLSLRPSLIHVSSAHHVTSCY